MQLIKESPNIHLTKFSAYTVVAMLSNTTCYIRDPKHMQL